MSVKEDRITTHYCQALFYTSYFQEPYLVRMTTS